MHQEFDDFPKVNQIHYLDVHPKEDPGFIDIEHSMTHLSISEEFQVITH